MERLNKFLRAAALAAFAALVVVASGSAQASAPALDRPQADYEVRFMEGMIDHHEMAVMMANICLQNATHPELLDLCTSIEQSQSAQIDQMNTWLMNWYGLSHTPEMTTGQQMKMSKLASETSAAFETDFMEMMIRHHWKAVVSASQCIQQAYHADLIELCQNIVTTQSAEIVEMRSWLCSWYGICNYGPKGAPLQDD